MIYELHFHPLALKEWKKLGKNLQEAFKKVLKRRLENPHMIRFQSRLHLDTSGGFIDYLDADLSLPYKLGQPQKTLYDKSFGRSGGFGQISRLRANFKF